MLYNYGIIYSLDPGSMKVFIILLDDTKEIVRVNEVIKHIRVRSTRILQSFTVLEKLEDIIWASVDEHGRFVVGIHGNSELTSNINKFQYGGNGICIVKKNNSNRSTVPEFLYSRCPSFVNTHIAISGSKSSIYDRREGFMTELAVEH